MQTMTKTQLNLVERVKPESYSATAALRLKPSEKKNLTDYAKSRKTSVDTILRSALVLAGVLSPA